MNANTQAWYREPWPWVLIGLPAIAVVASLLSAVLATQGADPIVEDDYYQRGLQINATLQRLERARQLDLHGSIEYDGVAPGAAVWVRVRSAQPLRDTTLQVEMIHPTRSIADRRATLGRVPGSPDQAPEFTGQWAPVALDDGGLARAAQAGNWRITIQGVEWELRGDSRGRSDIAAGR